MNNCCCAELVVDEGQQIELNVESDGGIEVGVAEQFVIGGGGNYQDKTVNITPTESAQSQTVRADVGYDALDEVEVNVAAIADDYVGSAVPRRASSSLTESGATVTAPAGYYASDADKTMTTGHMSVSATKGAVSNHSVSVTPKAAVDNAGYFATGDRTGTAVSVSASELDSGTKSITSNGNSQDVVGYAAVDVAVPNSYTSADEGKVVDNGALVSQSSTTFTQNGTYDTTLNNEVVVNVSGGGGISWDDIATRSAPSGEVSISGTSIGDYAFSYMGINAWSFVGDNVTSMGQNAFRSSTYVTSVKLPKLSSYPSTGYAFYGCSRLALVDYGVMATVRGNTFNNCSVLKTIILRKSDAPAALSATTTFNGSPFKSGGSGGTIYIPKSLYDHLGDGTSLDYKAATNWNTVDGYGTITWAKIEGSQYEL